MLYYEATVSLAQVQLWRLPEYIRVQREYRWVGCVIHGKKKKRVGVGENYNLGQPRDGAPGA